jgi:guanine deaminase
MNTPGVRQIFKALVINPVSLDSVEYYNPGFLMIEGEQIISLSSVEPRRDLAAERIDLTGRVILPGMIDTHVHLPQFAVMGIGSGELLEWLDTYTYPEETRFSDSAYARRVSTLFFDELVANGTTTAAIYCSVHEEATDIAFAAGRHKGIRAFIGKAMMERNCPSALMETADESIAASLRLFEKWDGAENGRLRYVFTPRFAAGCSMELMKRAGSIAAERQAYVQTHLSENLSEVNWIAGLFPECSSYTEVYSEAGLLGPRSIMGHCIHLTDREVSALARTNTKVSFCPYSNRTLRSGTMPYSKLKRAGLTIGLGTDVAGGPSLSMFRQLGEAMNSAGITPVEALYLATLGGARVLGLEDRVGNFSPGKDADFVVFDPTGLDPLHGAGSYKEPAHILSRICYDASRKHVSAVYIRGRAVG